MFPTVIFAAGFGTRMQALTIDTPKPLLSFNGRALIEHAIDHARDCNLPSISVNAHFQAEKIVRYFEGTDVSVFVEENDILDTGGGLKRISKEQHLNTVFTMNSDTIWTGKNPLRVLMERWNPETMDTLLLCVSPENAVGRTGKKGDFSIDDDNVIERGGIYTYASCQIIKSQFVRDFNQTVFSLNSIWDEMIQNKRAKAVIYPDPWIDIGTKQAFEQAKQRFHDS